VEEMVFAEESYIEVVETIVVVVADAGALPPTSETGSRHFRDGMAGVV